LAHSVVIDRSLAQVKDHFADLNVKPLQKHFSRATPRPDSRITHPGMELLLEDLTPTPANHLRKIGNVNNFVD
jgi:hypothetical protein